MAYPMTPYIPPMVRNTITCYLAGAACQDAVKRFQRPRMCIVAGPPGVGKSTAIRQICQELGVPLHPISASTLNGPDAGQAVAPLKSQYVRQARNPEGIQTAIVLEDFDQSVARIDEAITGTEHGPQLTEFLMSIADDPHKIEVSHATKPMEVQSLERGPALFMTVNDTRRIHEALKRKRRAVIVEWIASPEDLCEAVQRLYPRCTPANIRRLVLAFPGQPIAFYDEIGDRAVEAELSAFLDTVPPGRFQTINFAGLAAQLVQARQKLTALQLFTAARKLAAEDDHKSYLALPAAGQETDSRHLSIVEA
ncbi:MAG: AAA family ATPase [Gammaproteobacteria bacterium]